MKAVSKVLMLALIALVSFSCGKKDDPVPTPHQEIISKTWTIPIKGFEGQSVVLPEVSISLADIPHVEAANFTSGEFQNSGGSIQISGLKKLSGAVLNNFTMQVGNNAAVNFGTVTATPGANDFGSDVEQSGNRETQFLSALFSAYAGKGKTAVLKVSFTPSKDLVTADNINLLLTIKAKYNWNTFDK